MSTWKIVWIKGKDTFHYIGTNRPKYVKNVHWYRSAVLHPYKLTYKPLNNWKKKIQLYFPQFPIKNRLPLTKLYYLNEYKNILYLFKSHNIIFHIYIYLLSEVITWHIFVLVVRLHYYLRVISETIRMNEI